MKLWQKDYSINKEIEKFTVGDDYLTDAALLKHDVIGNIAHAMMLNKIKILSDTELVKLKIELKNILKRGLLIKPEDEDVHTAVENHLTKKLGGLGKKIHTARSRNDQVLVDTRLYTKEKLLEISESLLELISALIETAKKHEKMPMPGYTHMQKAMPSSVGLLFGAYSESLADDFELLKSAYMQNNQSPLGSAAGYGVSLKIDRNYTAKLLGFAKVQNNTLYVQNSRGKIESVVLFALSRIMASLAKIANDFILFSMPEFGYFSLPEELCTGSSIMPQKKNPDALELIRAKSSVVNSLLFQLNSITEKLMSGYNRDFQLTKKPLMEGFEITLSSLKIMALLVLKTKVNKEGCMKACTKEIFSADEAYKLVEKGMPFREAYKEIAGKIDRLEVGDPVKNIMSKKHIGAAGNLKLDNINIIQYKKWLKEEKFKFNEMLARLL